MPWRDGYKEICGGVSLKSGGVKSGGQGLLLGFDFDYYLVWGGCCLDVALATLGAMLSKTMAPGIVFSLLLASASASEDDRCNCDVEGFWSAESILECQRVSDFLIAVAYFSIPIELLYFVSCSNVPFKWVLSQFIAFIVLCGMTHLLNGWTYGPHPFQLMLAVTIFKLLTALVSCATAITLITLIPLLLKVKVREFMLRKKTWDLGREVGLIKKRKETGWYVRMLTQEIRKSLDRHTILYTTLVELSETLKLQNCAVWMPNHNQMEMNLTHELKGRNFYNQSIPISDPDVVRVKKSDEVNILSPASLLGAASIGATNEAGPVAAIRMPMLRVSDFKGGTPELIQTCYAILVLVLPSGRSRSWTYHELEIIKVVADQVAVALSHASVLEESQLMREKLEEQNRALQQARKCAMMANQARASFQKVMSNGVRRPMHSIAGLLSLLQDENMTSEKRLIVDALVKSNDVVSTLVDDLIDISPKNSGRFSPEIRLFQFHSMIREVACIAKCMTLRKGFEFALEVDKSLPNRVMGDERRVFQVIMHMLGRLLGSRCVGGTVMLRIFSENASQGSNEQKWATWIPNLHDEHIVVRFEIGVRSHGLFSQSPSSTSPVHDHKHAAGADLSFVMCKKLVQSIQGNIWEVDSCQDFDRGMALVLRFQVQSPGATGFSAEFREISDFQHSDSILRGLKVLLADDDNVNRAVTRKVLEKLGCAVSTASSAFECLSASGPSGSPVQIILLDLQMSELDGYEVAAKIRKFQSPSWPLIIALTTHADNGVWERCLQSGINGVVQKPVSQRRIADELRRVLAQAKKVHS
uniref:Ethylene receptor n=2 Tax=Kalanchoe fedtschenkoi TaxID=63787 RepID=A0A7N0UUD6_KALFE